MADAGADGTADRVTDRAVAEADVDAAVEWLLDDADTDAPAQRPAKRRPDAGADSAPAEPDERAVDPMDAGVHGHGDAVRSPDGSGDQAADGVGGAPAVRPTVTELRLSAFKSHRAAVFPLGPVTVFTGPAGAGKSSVLEALVLLSRLAAGDELRPAVGESVRGGADACVPEGSRPDDQGRRGFRLGCTVEGPAGTVRLDVAVQTEPELRVVGERLTGSGLPLLTTALRDPTRPTVQAAWHTAGAVPVTRAPLPDDRLATALLPLRVAGTTEGQRMVLAAAEQVLIALRAVFPVAPIPASMRRPVRVGDGMLRPGCDNLSAVLNRTRGECRTRHAALVGAARAACGGRVDGVVVLRRALGPGASGGPGRGGADAAGVGPAGRSGGSVGPGAAAGGGKAGATGGPGRRRPASGGGGAGPSVGPGVGRPAGSGQGTAVEGVLAALDRGPLGVTPVDRLGDSELRFLALALVLLTGPGVLEMDQASEVPAALRAMSVVADGLDSGLDRAQTGALISLALRAVEHGHVRVVGTAHDADAVGAEGVTVIPLGGPGQRPSEDRAAQAGPGHGSGMPAGRNG